MRTNKKKDKSKKKKHCVLCGKEIPEKNYNKCDKCKKRISVQYSDSDPPFTDYPEINISSIGGSGKDEDWQDKQNEYIMNIEIFNEEPPSFVVVISPVISVTGDIFY